MCSEALPGDHIGFLVEGISVKELQHDFVVSDVNNDPAQEVASFIAQVKSSSLHSSLCYIFLIFLRLWFLIIQVRSLLVTLQL